MRKTIILASVLVGLTATAQTDPAYNQRVGINTATPRASLEVRAVDFDGRTQGILFPHISETEKNYWTKDDIKGLVAGTVIWNTTKICLDYFDGTHWQCTDGTKKNEYGNEYGKYRANYTYTSTAPFIKNDCPIGQQGSVVNYTPTTPIIGQGESYVSQEDAQRIAEENAKAEFKRLGQLYANEKGSCIRPYRCLDMLPNIVGRWVLWATMSEEEDPVYWAENLVKGNGPVSEQDLQTIAANYAGRSLKISAEMSTPISVKEQCSGVPSDDNKSYKIFNPTANEVRKFSRGGIAEAECDVLDETKYTVWKVDVTTCEVN